MSTTTKIPKCQCNWNEHGGVNSKGILFFSFWIWWISKRFDVCMEFTSITFFRWNLFNCLFGFWFDCVIGWVVIWAAAYIDSDSYHQINNFLQILVYFFNKCSKFFVNVRFKYFFNFLLLELSLIRLSPPDCINCKNQRRISFAAYMEYYGKVYMLPLHPNYETLWNTQAIFHVVLPTTPMSSSVWSFSRFLLKLIRFWPSCFPE